MPYDAQGRYSRTGQYNANGKKISRKTRGAARTVKVKRANTGGISSSQLTNRFKAVGRAIRGSLKKATATKAKGGKGGKSGS